MNNVIIGAVRKHPLTTVLVPVHVGPRNSGSRMPPPPPPQPVPSAPMPHLVLQLFVVGGSQGPRMSRHLEPVSPVHQPQPLQEDLRVCKGLPYVRLWPSFHRSMEAEYNVSMVSYRVRMTLCYGFFYGTFIAHATVRHCTTASPFLGPQLVCSALFALASLPLLGLIPGKLGAVRALAWCLRQPRLVCSMGLLQVTVFVFSLLMYTKATGVTQSTTHLTLLWLMTMVGTSGLFDFWYYAMLFGLTSAALFYTFPTMDRTALYFIQGLGSLGALVATLQHELLVRRLFRQVKRETQFLARMSHEIRTPLNGVLGFLQVYPPRPCASTALSKHRDPV